MITRKEWFKRLPLRLRLMAMEETRKYNGKGYFNLMLNLSNHSQHENLIGSFNFSQSRQGHSYWQKVYEKYYTHET